MEGGPIDAIFSETDATKFKELLDAEVEVTGVVSGKFDSKMQLVGILLEVPSIADVKILIRSLSGCLSRLLLFHPVFFHLIGKRKRVSN
jgi:hypothetical protein